MCSIDPHPKGVEKDGDPKGWSTLLYTLGSWEKLVPRGHRSVALLNINSIINIIIYLIINIMIIIIIIILVICFAGIGCGLHGEAVLQGHVAARACSEAGAALVAHKQCARR
jgi:hypothetical protein